MDKKFGSSAQGKPTCEQLIDILPDPFVIIDQD